MSLIARLVQGPWDRSNSVLGEHKIFKIGRAGCKGCGWFFWHNFPTPLEHIPDDVQLRFVMVKSSKETGTPLVCQEPNCLTATNKRRRANRECGRVPPRCSGCCKTAGGCRAQSHRVNARDIPSASSSSSLSNPPLAAGVSGGGPSGTQNASASASGSSAITTGGPSASQTSSESNGIPSRTFARPLSETYAQGYLSRHRNVLEASERLEATERSQELRNKIQDLVVFIENGHPPSKFTVLNLVLGQFIVAEHQVLAPVVKNGFISYLELPSSKTWCIRDARVPIPASRSVRIILRSIDVTDSGCIGLDTEISRLLIQQSDVPSTIKTRRLLALSGSHPSGGSSPSPSPEPELPTAAPQVAAAGVVASEHREISPLKFPLTWACDMEAGLSRLRAERTGSGLDALHVAFVKGFPLCNFKDKTVYKHLKISDDAHKFGLLSGFVSVGKNVGGRWGDLVKLVEEHQPTAIEISDNDDDDDLEYNIMSMRKEVFTYYSEGRLQSQSDPKEIDVLVCDDVFDKGHKMNVYLGNYTDGSNEFIGIALKKLLPLDTTGYGSREMAIWCEGSRLAECRLQYAQFQSRAAALDIDLAAVDILETFLFCWGDTTFITQPWEGGRKFSVHDLDRESGPYNILTAFSHFTFQNSNHQSVYLDFQGFRTPTGYHIFDSLTHISDPDESTSTFPLLGSLGQDGIKQFVTDHTCGTVCKALKLNSLPLEFPSQASDVHVVSQSTQRTAEPAEPTST
ncbi:hypothetical protein B0H11DRAFT_1902457 [Mycena galericulata]|nr:hypothetical protein B0H11DRAFT_1902457 [Mycena galericulata]